MSVIIVGREAGGRPGEREIREKFRCQKFEGEDHQSQKLPPISNNDPAEEKMKKEKRHLSSRWAPTSVRRR